jgi:hypothetical protein
VLGIKVLGSLAEAGVHVAQTRPDEVLVTVPDVAPERLETVVSACAAAGVACRFVRREIAQPPSLLKASTE